MNRPREHVRLQDYRRFFMSLTTPPPSSDGVQRRQSLPSTESSGDQHDLCGRSVSVDRSISI